MAHASMMETVTLKQAKAILASMAHRQSILLLSGPGVGKSDCVRQAAEAARLPYRSLVGTQIAPEDVSGIPRIIGERSVFCPPRVLLPENSQPFCMFLDELPACTPDIQKAFYSLLLERRLGEHLLPAGTWVVAAGNRIEDRSLVRALSSALVNRVIILQVRVDVDEWLEWGRGQRIRTEVLSFLEENRDALIRAVPDKSVPFSTPRAWASLAQALDLVEAQGLLKPEIRLALAAGRVSSKDAEAFCLFAERRHLRQVSLSGRFSEALTAKLRERGIETADQLLEETTGAPEKDQADSARAPTRGFLRIFDWLKKDVASPHGSSLKPADTTLLTKTLHGVMIEIGIPEEWISEDDRTLRLEIPEPGNVRISLSQAKALLKCLAADESLLFQSAPGVGKTAIVAEAGNEAGLMCRSLLGTQIAPEDVSGIPRIVGERSVFCPPRMLLPEDPRPFCLFLDELPACSADVQKAFYPLILERRLGEHMLPKGSWVVAAGNRVEDRAMVRDLSAALINRLFLLQIRVDVNEWFRWAQGLDLRQEILLFLQHVPEALLRSVPAEPVPFSTPRAWAMLAEALDQAEKDGILTREIRRALVFGRVSAEDASMFCAVTEESIAKVRPAEYYLDRPEEMPTSEAPRWFVLNRIRRLVEQKEVTNRPPEVFDRFFRSLNQEHRLMLMVDLVDHWGKLGAETVMLETVWEVTGVKP
jgi:MoxR-like ATPase